MAKILALCLLLGLGVFSCNIPHSSASLNDNSGWTAPDSGANSAAGEIGGVISAEGKKMDYTPGVGTVQHIHLGGVKNLDDLAFKILKFLNFSIAAISVLGVMIGGVILIIGAGNDAQISQGKDIIKYSIIGLVMTVGAYLIVTLVQTLLYSIG